MLTEQRRGSGKLGMQFQESIPKVKPEWRRRSRSYAGDTKVGEWRQAVRVVT